MLHKALQKFDKDLRCEAFGKYHECQLDELA